MTQLSQLLCSELIGKIFNFCPIFIEICSRARGVIPSNVAGDGGGGLPLNITIFYCIAPGARSLHLRIQCLEFIKIAFLARSQEIYIIIPCGRRREKVEIKLKKCHQTSSVLCLLQIEIMWMNFNLHIFRKYFLLFKI